VVPGSGGGVGGVAFLVDLGVGGGVEEKRNGEKKENGVCDDKKRVG